MRDTDIFGAVETGKATIRDTDIFGTPEKQAPPKMSVLPTMRDSLREEMAGRPGAALLAGIGTALDNPALRLKQMFSGLSPQEEANVQANRDLLKASPWALGGNILGNAAPVGMMAGPRVVGNMVAGAGAGAMEPVLGDESAARNTLVGGAAGAAGAAAGRVLTGSPVVRRTPEVDAMLAEGVVPTLGQAASTSPSRVAQALGRAEERATSILGVGDIIGGARRRAVEDFNRAALTRSRPPGQAATGVGDEGVQAARTALGDAYDRVYANAWVRNDPAFMRDVAAAINAPVVPLSDPGRAQFIATIQRAVFDRFPAQGLPAGRAKMEIEADLGRAIRDHTGPGATAAERALGESFRAARDAFRALMARNVGPRAAELPPLNQAYANLQSVRAAAERARGQGGVFSPFQLQSSTRPGTPMRDFANTGQSVLGSHVPNSGTVDRGALYGLLAAGTPAAAGMYFGAPMLSSLAAAPLAYSRTGARWLLGDISPQAMQSLAPYLAQGYRAQQTDEQR